MVKTSEKVVKKVATLLVTTVMAVTLFTTIASAASSGWQYIGYSCGSSDCGLFWKNNQKYNQYKDSNGYLRTESAGFGVCC